MRLWDVDTGKEIRVVTADPLPATGSYGLNWLTFSPDGKRFLTATEAIGTSMWDAETGKEIRKFATDTGWIYSAAFSPDGKRVLGNDAGTVRLWDAETGKEVLTFTGHTKSVDLVAFSPDGTRVLTSSIDNTARLWDVGTGKELRSFDTAGQCAAFSPDGKRVLTCGADNTARLWDASSGKELRSFKGHTAPVASVAFSSDGKRVLTGSKDTTARLWDADTGKEIRAFDGRTLENQSVVFSPNGTRVLVETDDKWHLRDAGTGKEIRRFRGPKWVVFSPDGKRVIVGKKDEPASLLEVDTGKEIRRFEGEIGGRDLVAFSPDGARVLIGSGAESVILWETNTGKELRRFQSTGTKILSVALSPDGKRALTGDDKRYARLWDVDTGKAIESFQTRVQQIDNLNESEAFKAARLAADNPVKSVAFSPDGKRLLTVSKDGPLLVWGADTGKELRDFGARVNSAEFSPDGKRVLTSQWRYAYLSDADTGEVIRTFEAHLGEVTSASFVSNGTRAMTISKDKTVRFWDVDTGKELCQLINFRDGAWAVVDGTGRYDASNGGDVDGLHWVIGNEPIALNQLKERYYDPGLLAKHLGLNKDPLRSVDNFFSPRLFPHVRVEQPNKDEPKFRVSLTNRDGGIGRVVVRVNGKELTADARARGADSNAEQMEVPIDLTGDPRLKPDDTNVVEVEAYNAEGYLRSRGMEVRFTARGQKVADPPEVWIVAVGISKYAGEGLELRFAAKDAQDMARALEVAAGELFDRDRKGRMHLTLLSTAEEAADRQPTRANIVRALEGLKKSRPRDVVIVYFAGHGVNEGGAEGDYYYLTAEARSGNLADPEVRAQTALSSQQLADQLRQVPAEKLVLILDTCAAGRALGQLAAKRDLPSSHIRALERVKDRAGTHILAGCAADSVSYEATRFAQGVLTYSLLMGMRGAALKEDQHVDVFTLFNFASDRVRELARDLGGIQEPVVSSPRGASFPIGLVTPADQAKIPLRPARPLVVRGNFQDEDTFDDALALGRRVDEKLRVSSARGGADRVVFVDAREMADAYRVVGRYRTEKGKVTVTVRLIRGLEKVDPFTVAGEESKPDELAEHVAAEIEKRLTAPAPKK